MLLGQSIVGREQSIFDGKHLISDREQWTVIGVTDVRNASVAGVTDVRNVTDVCSEEKQSISDDEQSIFRDDPVAFDVLCCLDSRLLAANSLFSTENI